MLLSSTILPAHATCNQTTVIRNTSNITLRFAELKSASSPPFFDSQWTGSRVIPPGDTRQIRWVSDVNCTDGVGVPNVWHLKLIRNNGNVHYCTNIGPSGDVRVDIENSCLPD
ncbi:MAG: hypothetical protein AAGA68_24570 [Pseudomonadota bacterium]